MEIAAVLQPSAAGAKVVRGTYLKISAEKKAEIGQHAVEHGVLAIDGSVLRYEASGYYWYHAYTLGWPETH